MSPNPTDLVHYSARLLHCHLQVQGVAVSYLQHRWYREGLVRQVALRSHPAWVSDLGEETVCSPGLGRGLPEERGCLKVLKLPCHDRFSLCSLRVG